MKKQRTLTGKIFIYFIVPIAGSLLFIGAYFSGNVSLERIVSPAINREYGLLENLQALMLFSIALIAAMGLIRKKSRFEKAIMAVVLFASLFMFLEELDYGLHYYRLWIGKPVAESRGEGARFNVHNVGESTFLFKNACNIIMIVLFILFPLFFARSKKPFLRYITPSRWFIGTMIGMFAVSKLAHALKKAGLKDPGSLYNSISEFRELIIYYIFLVYFFELVFEKNLPEEG